MDSFYSYPTSHAGFSVGDAVTYPGKRAVYVIERIQVRNSDQSPYFFMRSNKQRAGEHRIDRLRKA
jgi:hypothetical protein